MKNMLRVLLVVMLLGVSSGRGEDLPGKVFGLWHFQEVRRLSSEETWTANWVLELTENTYQLNNGKITSTEVTVKDGEVHIIRTDTPFKDPAWVFRVIDENTLEANFGEKRKLGIVGVNNLTRVTTEQRDTILAEEQKRYLERKKNKEEAPKKPAFSAEKFGF